MPKKGLNEDGVGTTPVDAQEVERQEAEQGAFDWGAAADAAADLEAGEYDFQGYSFKRGVSQAGKPKFVIGLAPLKDGEPNNDKAIFLHLQPKDAFKMLTAGFLIDPTGSLDGDIRSAVHEGQIHGKLTYGEPDKQGRKWPRLDTYQPV